MYPEKLTTCVMLGLAALCSCAVLLAPLDAFACSPIRGYTRPTNIELVQRADAIVIAKSRRLLRTSAGDRIVLSVEDVIKGAVPVGEELVIRGTHAAHTEPDGEVEDFSNPRRGAFAGGCIAYDYSLWGNYLLFLGRVDGGGWSILGYPFTRVNEQVAGRRDDWEVAVRHYHAASLLPAPARDALLRKLATMAEVGTDPALYPRAMASDITTHFATPTQFKPAKALVAMYAQREEPRERLRILWSLAHGKDREGLDFMRAKLFGKLTTPELEALAVYFAEVEDREATEKMLSITLSMVRREFNTYDYWRPLFVLITHARVEDEEAMREIYAGTNDEGAAWLEEWFKRIESEGAAGALGRAREARLRQKLLRQRAAKEDP